MSSPELSRVEVMGRVRSGDLKLRDGAVLLAQRPAKSSSIIPALIEERIDSSEMYRFAASRAL